MKIIALAVLAALSFSAQATVFGNTDNSTTNAPVANGGKAESSASAGAIGVGVGVGIGGAGGAGGNAAQQQGQVQGQQQGQTATGGSSDATGGNATGGNATGGAGGSATGNGSGNATSVSVKSERSAPGVSASAPVQVRNCRLGIGGGGSNTSGSMTAAIIIGNDQTCLSAAATEAMEVANARYPGTYSRTDYLTMQCKVEGMSDTDACKNFAEGNRAKALLEGQSRSNSVAYYGN
jgi:hypothetical protein